MDGVEIWCGWCAKRFSLCRSCYRNHRYCSVPCREFGTRRAHREAVKRWARSEEGRESRRKQQRNYRRRKAAEREPKKSVSDKSSGQVRIPIDGTAQAAELTCSICGRRIFRLIRSLGRTGVRR